jgi:sialate O-acetylesterase
MKLSSILLTIFLILGGCQKSSKIVLPSLIGDNMLLQQKTTAKIWGKATPGQKIKVTGSWNAEASATAGENGKWTAAISTPEAGGPYVITVSAKDTTITINNVLIGEVWFCSGQSNMEMPVAGWPPNDTIMGSKKTIANASIPEIRLFNVTKKIASEPMEECVGKWEVCSPESVNQFSATAFFFGKKLQSELKIPVGLIESSWGGTPSEAWTSSESLKKTGEFVSVLDKMKESEPLIAEYNNWLSTLKMVSADKAGDDKYKDLVFNDEKVPEAEYNDSEWPSMTLPANFETVIGDFDGSVWFRKIVEVPKNMTGKDLVLSLGPIDDMDRTYFNGKLVGASESGNVWSTDRNYEVPATLVKEGNNVVSVRVIDTGGGGGLYGKTDQLKLTVKGDPKVLVALNGDWKYQPVAEYLNGKFYVYNDNKEFQGKKRPVNLNAGTPTVLYNGMVNPVLPYQIKGALWYQGEANVGRAEQYKKIFPAMIENWREAWGIKDFPFYFVQIAPYVYAGVDSTESAVLREAQESALSLPKTGMAITLDIATVNNIHPPFKMEVGERLALLALNNDYGKNIPYKGPVYKSMEVKGNTITLKFDNIGSGLAAKDNKLTEFEVAGNDGKFKKANAKIVNDEVVVSSSVSEPAAVRYCWRNGSQASLFNKEGFAALQFRTR